MYITQNEYATYGGISTGMSSTEFNNIEYRARRVLDSLTQKRLTLETPVRESAKRCMVAMIDTMLDMDRARSASAGIASASNDGVSVSYKADIGAEETKRLIDIAVTYLADEATAEGILLLYAGWY